MLYEAGDPDPLAVILGAESLSDAVTTLDSLQRVADQSRQFVQASTSAEQRLARLRVQLATRHARIVTAVDATRRTTVDLASRALGPPLVHRRPARAAGVEGRADPGARSKRPTGGGEVADADGAGGRERPRGRRSPRGVSSPSTRADSRAGRWATDVDGVGHRLLAPGAHRSGLPVGWGVVAVDPTVIPLGTRMTIPGYGEGVAADDGSGIRGARSTSGSRRSRRRSHGAGARSRSLSTRLAPRTGGCSS